MTAVWLPSRRFVPVLPDQALAAVPAAAQGPAAGHRRRADGRPRRVLRSSPARTWSRRTGPLDPKTGRRAPTDLYAFDIAYRDENAVGDIKQLWEPSRHQHLTVLAAAYALTGEEQYADRVAEHLRSWWAANPPLRGVHWVSGIELGIRLHLVGVDPPAARPLVRRRRAVRGQPRGAAPDLAPPALARRARQPRLVRQQPRDRRGGRAARGRVRVRLVPRVARLAGRGAARARRAAAPQHVRVRAQPRAGHRVPRPGAGAGARGGASRPTRPGSPCRTRPGSC